MFEFILLHGCTTCKANSRECLTKHSFYVDLTKKCLSKATARKKRDPRISVLWWKQIEGIIGPVKPPGSRDTRRQCIIELLTVAQLLSLHCSQITPSLTF